MRCDTIRPVGSSKGTTIKTAQRLNRCSGILAASVLCDSAIEHYRGNFQNPAMVTPIATSLICLLASIHGHGDNRQGTHHARSGVFWLTAATGLIGTGFHWYNITKKPGGLSWQNLFYSAPIGAPAAIGLAGLFGLLAERVRDTPPGEDPKLLGRPAGRMLGLAAAASLLGMTGEAGLLHLRGSFQNPAMYLPVTMPPLASALLANAALGASAKKRPVTRAVLGLTALMGVAGTGFHIYGVSRAMGGWKNWRQNMVDGPPIPAPPSFVGLALAGLAALTLMRAHSED
jgi:heme/copper-type cytochrome/quinol oxidase subunit 3